MPRLHGERIILREFKKEDLEHMRKWVNDPAVVDNLLDSFLFPNTLPETEKFINDVIEGKSGLKGFVIEEKTLGRYIGQMALANIDWKNRVAQIAIVIAEAEFRGKGYGTEAIRLLEEFAFDRMNLHRLELSVHDYNIAAYKCYRKCGFTEEGRKRQDFYIHGKYTDTIYLGLLKSEYEEMKKCQ